MHYLSQFGIILGMTFAGEVLGFDGEMAGVTLLQPVNHVPRTSTAAIGLRRRVWALSKMGKCIVFSVSFIENFGIGGVRFKINHHSR